MRVPNGLALQDRRKRRARRRQGTVGERCDCLREMGVGLLYLIGGARVELRRPVIPHVKPEASQLDEYEDCVQETRGRTKLVSPRRFHSHACRANHRLRSLQEVQLLVPVLVDKGVGEVVRVNQAAVLVNGHIERPWNGVVAEGDDLFGVRGRIVDKLYIATDALKLLENRRTPPADDRHRLFDDRHDWPRCPIILEDNALSEGRALS